MLAALLGALSMQLMAKQRLHEQMDTKYLAEWEKQVGATAVQGFAPHDPFRHQIDGIRKVTALELQAGWWSAKSSYRLWMWGLRGLLGSSAGFSVWVIIQATAGS